VNGLRRQLSLGWVGLGALLAALPVPAGAGAFLFAGETYGIDLITHPIGYTGSGGTLTVRVCLDTTDPTTASLVAQLERPVRNIIATYNRMTPTIGNLRTGIIQNSQIDFESVALHELGHCLGAAHVNLASESGLSDPQANATKTTDGADNVFNTNAGGDGVYGSPDDTRGDDVNLHWFRQTNNNPFTLADTVDITTYARDTAQLPSGHEFAANGDRGVASTTWDIPSTETVMQQGTYYGEIQRTLGHDDVATLRLAEAGNDHVAGTADDYTVWLEYTTNLGSCDIKLAFDINTGLAYCQVSGSLSGGNAVLDSASMHFNPNYAWFFDTDATPCSVTMSVPQNQWKQFGLPCLPGISTGETVANVLGDDLAGTYGQDWVVYRWDAAAQSYVKLAETDAMTHGVGYWIYTTQAGQSITVDGQYPAAPDIVLRGDNAGRPNLIAYPYDFSNVSWSRAQFVSPNGTVKDLNQAVSDGNVVRTYWIWNGANYDAYDDQAPGMIRNLQAGDGIWIKVYTDGLRFRMRPS